MMSMMSMMTVDWTRLERALDELDQSVNEASTNEIHLPIESTAYPSITSTFTQLNRNLVPCESKTNRSIFFFFPFFFLFFFFSSSLFLFLFLFLFSLHRPAL